MNNLFDTKVNDKKDKTNLPLKLMLYPTANIKNKISINHASINVHKFNGEIIRCETVFLYTCVYPF